MLLTAVVFAQRTLTIASGLGWSTSWFAPMVVGALVLGALHAALASRVRASVAAELLKQLLRGLCSSQQHDLDEPVVALSQATNHAMRLVVDDVVGLAASGGASIFAIIALVLTLNRETLTVAASALGVAVAIVVVARATVERVSRETLEAYQRAMDTLEDALYGSVEIASSNAESRFLAHADGFVARWRGLVSRADLLYAVSGRAPMVFVGALAALLVVLHQGTGAAVVRDGVLIASCVPTVLALLTGTLELYRAPGRVGPLVTRLTPSAPRLGAQALPRSIQLSWRAISVAFGDNTILDRAELTASPRELLAITGANGAGKTTLLHLAVGWLSPDHGAIEVGGVALSDLDLDAWRARVRYLPQRPYLLPRRTVRDALRFPSYEHDDEALSRALAEVNLEVPLERVTDQLSAGERQRLALARLLLKEGDAYLLDEPDANLDAAGVEMIARMMETWAASGKIVVVAAHTPELVARAHRVVRVEGGRVIEAPRSGSSARVSAAGA